MYLHPGRVLVMEKKTEAAVKTATCGCTFQGRFYSTRECTVLDHSTATGRQRIRHAMSVKKHAA